jgi:hypothetical protein
VEVVMRYLLIASLLWAFSCGLIGEYLADSGDSYFAALGRVLSGALPLWSRDADLLRLANGSAVIVASLLLVGVGAAPRAQRVTR